VSWGILLTTHYSANYSYLNVFRVSEKAKIMKHIYVKRLPKNYQTRKEKKERPIEVEDMRTWPQ
jgi:hypothetical protein